MKPNSLRSMYLIYFSWRGDLNARPLAPKADFSHCRRTSIFRNFCFKQMRGACWAALNGVAFGSFGRYNFIYSARAGLMKLESKVAAGAVDKIQFQERCTMRPLSRLSRVAGSRRTASPVY